MIRNCYLSRMAAVAALLCGLSGALAGDIYVGGPAGVVYVGDSDTGNFEFFGVCGGPIDSMVIHNGQLFLGDPAGVVYVLDLATGAVDNVFAISNDATAMVVSGGDLLISGSAGGVIVVDPATGAELDSWATPVDIWSMTGRDDYVYIAGPSMDVHRASTGDGVFSYFSCLCFGPTHALTTTDTQLYIGDEFNTVWYVSLADGAVQNAFFVAENATALIADGDEILVGCASGAVSRVNNVSGAVQTSFAAPIAIQAMAMPPAPLCVGDVTGNGAVDLSDLSELLSNYGTSSGAAASDGDTDNDGDVDLADLAALLSVYGALCQ